MATPTSLQVPDRVGPLGVARLLVLLQGAVLVASTIESLVVVAAMGPASLPTTILTGAAALLTLLTATFLARCGRWARRWTVVAELGVLLLAAADLATAALLGGLELMPMTVALRVVVPIAVLAILLHPSVRRGAGRRGERPGRHPVEPGHEASGTGLATEGGPA